MVKQIKNAFRKKRRTRRNRKIRKMRKFVKDPSVLILNDKTTFKPLTVTKTCSEYQTYSWVSGQTPVAFFKFDPAGVYGNNSSSGTPLKVADWDNLCNIYDQYKVKSITVNLRFSNTGANNISYPVLLRYGYDHVISSPTTTLFNELPRVVKKVFDNTHTQQSYKFYPKYQFATAADLKFDPSGNLYPITSGLGVKGGGWLDTDHPTELMGFMILCQSALNGCELYMSYEYEMKFRYAT